MFRIFFCGIFFLGVDFLSHAVNGIVERSEYTSQRSPILSRSIEVLPNENTEEAIEVPGIELPMLKQRELPLEALNFIFENMRNGSLKELTQDRLFYHFREEINRNWIKNSCYTYFSNGFEFLHKSTLAASSFCFTCLVFTPDLKLAIWGIRMLILSVGCKFLACSSSTAAKYYQDKISSRVVELISGPKIPYLP